MSSDWSYELHTKEIACRILAKSKYQVKIESEQRRILGKLSTLIISFLRWGGGSSHDSKRNLLRYQT